MSSITSLRQVFDESGGVFSCIQSGDTLEEVEMSFFEETLEGLPMHIFQPLIIEARRLVPRTVGTATEMPRETWSWRISFSCQGDDCWMAAGETENDS